MRDDASAAAAPGERITADARAIVDVAHLCFAATVTPTGHPNVSPKGTIRVWDGNHLFFCDIASPQTRTNLLHNPWIEVNVVDQLSRRGYRFRGRGSVHVGDHIYDVATQRIFEEEHVRYSVAAVILVAVEHVEPLRSPGYGFVKDERQMRELWRERRATLDRAFERYLADGGTL